MARQDKDKVTVLIVPHTGKEPVSLKVPVRTPHFLVAILVLGVIFLSVFIQAYLHMSYQVEELSHLKEVTRAQKAEINHLSNQTLQLMRQVEEVEELSQQIRDILGLQEQVPGEGLEGLAGERPLLADRGGFRLGASSMELEHLGDALAGKAEELGSLIGAAEDYRHRMEHTPSMWPTQGRVTSKFGYRRSPFTRRMEFHSGIDIANSSGTPIIATASGRVVEASYRRGWGRLIILEHGYGFRTYYAHLRGYAVEVGDTVAKGQLIGYMGNSGASTGTHLHYEVHYNGERMNPREYMN